MEKKINTQKIQECIREIIIALGDNPDREGLIDTPKRVAKMYEEVFEGMTHSNEEIAKILELHLKKKNLCGKFIRIW